MATVTGCGLRRLAAAWLAAGISALLFAPTPAGAGALTSLPAASLGVDRPGHSATLLGDGRVLVAGGAAGEASAELFDPVEGTWHLTGAMSAPRAYHTATLLADGRVLVTGGTDEAAHLATAEVFDPTARRWRAVGPMGLPRAFHTATLLADGRVLVVGGTGDGHGPYQRESELFDPRSETWGPAGTVEIGRSAHTATRLVDGTVLVTGGQGAAHDVSLRDAALYHPGTNAWTPVPALMATGRALHTATLLGDGTVLVVGGTGLGQGDGDGSSIQSSVERYDPATSSFLPGPALPGPRMAHSAVALPSGVAVVGGRGPAQGRPVDTLLFDPPAGEWRPLAPLRRAAETGQQTATLLERAPCGAACGRVVVVGDRSVQLWAPAAADVAAVVAALGEGNRSSPDFPLGLAAGGTAAAAVAGGLALIVTRRQRRRRPRRRARQTTARSAPEGARQEADRRHATMVTDQPVPAATDRRRSRRRPAKPAADAQAAARAEAAEVLAVLAGGVEALRAGLHPLAELRRPRLLGKVEEEQARVERAAAGLAQAEQALASADLGSCGRAVGDAHRELCALGAPLSLALSRELAQSALPPPRRAALEASLARQAAVQQTQHQAGPGTPRTRVLAAGPVLLAMGAAWACAAAALAEADGPTAPGSASTARTTSSRRRSSTP